MSEVRVIHCEKCTPPLGKEELHGRLSCLLTSHGVLADFLRGLEVNCQCFLAAVRLSVSLQPDEQVRPEHLYKCLMLR